MTSSGLEPVEVEVRRHHAFVKRSIRGCGFVDGAGQVCGGAKTAVEHVGASSSLNVLGSGNQFAYQALKKSWAEALTLALEASSLPRGLAGVLVEGLMCFPDKRKRDQGNHRFIVEKALGDALVAGGWLADDSWDRFEFGNLQQTHVKGEAWTRLMVFPRAGD